ncbi:hypothetical protein [Streptomyces sp. NPDC051576]|uniref:hypothetical protein n=1 Tax=Streptomyces sp. NPDC051576 TaxID=3155803 RepID=UPI003442C517
MSAMHEVLVGMAALVLAAETVAGIATIAKGRIVRPAGRRGIPRPRLWGYGTVVSAVGLADYVFLGPLNSAPFAHMALAATGLGLFFVGQAVQWLARRTGRVPGTGVTESAS